MHEAVLAKRLLSCIKRLKIGAVRSGEQIGKDTKNQPQEALY